MPEAPGATAQGRRPLVCGRAGWRANARPPNRPPIARHVIAAAGEHDASTIPTMPTSRDPSRPMRPRLLVTAGPTHEPIDRVRFIGNRSSGRLGIAIAKAAADRGIPTTLLLGPVENAPDPTHPQIEVRRFRTAAELASSLEAISDGFDLVIMAAAVADFRPRSILDGKHRRTEAGLAIELEPVPDLLAGLAARRRPGQRLVGFALEPEAELETRAIAKLRRKAIDAIVANPLETMEAAEIRGIVHFADGTRATPPEHPAAIDKDRFAAWLVDLLADPRTAG
jgi:phosphopantothenoylcysteine decarboxylase / phosphopantothenate---cysteine ligase